MSTVKKLAEEISRGIKEWLPALHKLVVRKLSLLVGTMIEGQTPNTAKLANLLPIETERQEWIRRLLTASTLTCEVVIAPFAQETLTFASQHSQVILLSMDQTELGNRMAVLMITARVGDRSLPLTWLVEEGAANIGFTQQKIWLERVLAWLPAQAKVMLLADRFYPSVALFDWLTTHQWQYRLRLKGNLTVELGEGDETTTGALAAGQQERYLPTVRLFTHGHVMTHVGILHETGYNQHMRQLKHYAHPNSPNLAINRITSVGSV
jgi:hypothetical protein